MKLGLISFTCLALLSCRSTNLVDWPANLPDRGYFTAAYHSDQVNQEVQSQREYLGWVLSFYEGTLVAPIGWTEMQATVVSIAAINRRSELDCQLGELGAQIAAEWAKENDHRFIDSRMLSIWGSVLQLVAEPDQQYAAIQLVRDDVEALLGGTLSSSEIQDARYEELLGLDLFGGF